MKGGSWLVEDQSEQHLSQLRAYFQWPLMEASLILALLRYSGLFVFLSFWQAQEFIWVMTTKNEKRQANANCETLSYLHFRLYSRDYLQLMIVLVNRIYNTYCSPTYYQFLFKFFHQCCRTAISWHAALFRLAVVRSDGRVGHTQLCTTHRPQIFLYLGAETSKVRRTSPLADGS